MRLKVLTAYPLVALVALGCAPDSGSPDNPGAGGYTVGAGGAPGAGGTAPATGGTPWPTGAAGPTTTAGSGAQGQATGGVGTGGDPATGLDAGGQPTGGMGTGGDAAVGLDAGGQPTGGVGGGLGDAAADLDGGGRLDGGGATGGAGAGGTGSAGEAGAEAAAGGTATAGTGAAGQDTAGSDGGGSDPSCPMTGSVTYTLVQAARPNAQQQAAYDAITEAMDTAVEYYNCYTDIEKELRVQYEPSVPTADGNVNGSIRFGSQASMNHITAMHEIAHTVGIGSGAFGALVVNGIFTGVEATNQLREITGNPGDELHADSMHFWPYGLNYTSEVTSTDDLVNHCKMVVAIRRDMGW